MKIVFEKSDKQKLNSIKRKAIVLGSLTLGAVWKVACDTVDTGASFANNSIDIIKADDKQINALINRSLKNSIK